MSAHSIAEGFTTNEFKNWMQVSLSRVQYQQIIDSLDNLNWNKVEASVSSPESNPEFPTTRSRPKRVGERELLLKLKFQLPRFSMELLDHSLRAIVSLSFEDFQVPNRNDHITLQEW